MRKSEKFHAMILECKFFPFGPKTLKPDFSSKNHSGQLKVAATSSKKSKKIPRVDFSKNLKYLNFGPISALFKNPPPYLFKLDNT